MVIMLNKNNAKLAHLLVKLAHLILSAKVA